MLLSEQQFDRLFEVNVKATFFLIKEMLDLLLKNQSGDPNILITSSIVSKQPDVYGGVYAMTKASLNNLATWLSKELEDSHIRVNTILPGAIKTDMIAKQA